MALWPYSQMHAFPKVDVFSKKSNLYLCTKSAWKYLEKQVKLFLRPIQVVRITLSMAKKSLGRDFVQTPVNPHLFRLRLYFFQIRITALMMNIMLIVDPQDRQWWKINISAMAKFFLLLVFPELVFSPVFSRPFFKWFFTGLLGRHEKHKIWDFSIRWWWGVSPAIKFFFNYCFFVIPSTITIINNNVLEKVLLEGWGVRDLLSKTLIFFAFLDALCYYHRSLYILCKNCL